MQKVFIKEQTTFDTFIAFVATDAVSPVLGTFKIEPTVNFEKLKEAVGTASLQSEVKLDRGGKWSGSFYVKPAALGTAPDIGPALLKAAFGVETLTGSTSAAYTLSDTVLTPLQMMQVIDGHWSQCISGAWVEELKFDIPGNGLPTISASGGFARMGWVYRDVISAAQATGQTSMEIANASMGCACEPAMVEFTGDDNSAAGYLITAHDWTAGSANFTISPGIAGAGLAGTEEILPFVLAPTTGGTAIGATACDLEFDTLSVGFIKAGVTLQTGIGARDKEATSDRAAGLMRVGPRVVEAEIDFYFLDTNAGNEALLGYAFDGTTYDTDLRVGANTAAARMKLNFPKSRLDFAPHEVPEADVVTVSAKLVARQNAAACDEFDLLFD